ncbi:hypothetical protein BH09BAC5_BH09BAC5_17780 [soil metagenome]
MNLSEKHLKKTTNHLSVRGKMHGLASVKFIVFFAGIFFNGILQSQSFLKTETIYRNLPKVPVVRPYQRLEYSYDSLHYKTQMISKAWDFEKGDWAIDRKTDYINTENGLVLACYSYDNYNGKWLITRKDTFEYSSIGQCVILTGFTPSSTGWIGDGRHFYTYDSLQNKNSDTYQLWKSGAWENLVRSTVDSSGKQLDERWNKEKREWINISRNNGNTEFKDGVKYVTENKWDTIGKKWIPDYRLRYIFGSDGRRTEGYFDIYDVKANTWEINFKFVFKYNEHGEQVWAGSYKQESTSDKWRMEGYTIQDYFYFPSEILQSKTYSIPVVIDTLVHIHAIDSVLPLGPVTKSNPVAEGDILLSPNPAHDIVMVTHSGNPNSVCEITIFDPRGKMIGIYKKNGLEMTIPLSGLRPGTYILDFENKDDNIYIIKNLYIE